MRSLDFRVFNTEDIRFGILEIQSLISDLLYRELALHVKMDT